MAQARWGSADQPMPRAYGWRGYATPYVAPYAYIAPEPYATYNYATPYAAPYATYGYRGPLWNANPEYGRENYGYRDEYGRR